ncbi:MAG: hypothetical protein AB1584_01025 [Pseudomonadota bacterium]
MGRPRPTALLAAALCAALCLPAVAAGPHDDADAHRFGVIGHSFDGKSDKRFRQALADTADKANAFVVVTGIKHAAEPCGDRLYQERRELVERFKRPVIVLPAGSDWTGCRNSAGRTNAIERLNRLRELFHGEPHSLGKTTLPLTRLSMSPRFRSYAENAHWTVGKVLYASVNLPANNNHYLAAAGRNSEYEDRLVANRFWLNRLFTLAKGDKVDAIVLFSEGDLKPFAEPEPRTLLRRAAGVFDGFAFTRRQVQQLAKKFRGKVLLVDSAPLGKGKKPAIEWHGNLGQLSVNGEAVEVEVKPESKALFVVKEAAE